MVSADLTAVEVAQVLREIVQGNRSIRLCDPNRHWSSDGDIPFLVDDWVIEFNCNLSTLNYVASAQAADGRKAVFDDWPQNPQNLLTCAEIAQLDNLLMHIGG